MPTGGFWFTDLGAFIPSFTVAPNPIFTSATTTVTLTGNGTNWGGTTAFSLSGVAGCSIVGSPTILSTTSALLTISTSSTTGTLTITESVTGTSQGTVGVAIAPVNTNVKWRLGRTGGAGATGERRLGRPMLK